jgi:hypothetical protein
VEAAYVDLFDCGRATSLHLFEHVHGDSRDRGPAMIDLAQTYERAGLYLGEGQLPDYLPVVLEFVSTQPPAEARAFLGEMAHIFNAIFGALCQRGTPYASILGALLELAGEKAQAARPRPEVPLDEAWAEPVVFDGCSTQGQARPGTPQPIHVVRRSRHAHPAHRVRSRIMNSVHGRCTTSLHRLPLHLPVGVPDGQPGPLRPRPVHLEERFLADAARRHLRWGSNLFHIGILFLFFGHFVGLLTPHWLYEHFMTAPQKQVLAVVAGGTAGWSVSSAEPAAAPALFDPRIRLTSHRTDIAILVILWVQLVIGLITLPFSLGHMCGRQRDAGLADWAQRIVTLRPDADGLVGLDWPSRCTGAGHDDLPAVPVQPAGACVERLCHGGLPVPPAPGGAQPPAQPAAGHNQPRQPGAGVEALEITMPVPTPLPPPPRWHPSTACRCTAPASI